jgi:hypothetical protein
MSPIFLISSIHEKYYFQAKTFRNRALLHKLVFIISCIQFMSITVSCMLIVEGIIIVVPPDPTPQVMAVARTHK